MADVRYQFFLISTFEDLRRERQQVIEAVLELGHIPVGMEVFPSADETPWEIIRRTIAQSDYYVVLSAGRYGSCDERGRSYTEREFDLAVELNVPIIGFLAHKPFDRPEAERDDDPVVRRRLLGFQSKIRERHVRTWKTADELGLLASKSIIHATTSYPRIGWVRADQAKSLDDFQTVESLRSQLADKDALIGQLSDRLDDADQLFRQTILQEDDLQPELLARGNDLADVPVKFTISGVKIEKDFQLSWDSLFSIIAPKLYNVRMRRNYTGRFDFERDLSNFIKEQLRIEAPNAQVRISARFIESLLFQFKQLGLIMVETGDQGEAWWTLTPKGESHMTRLLVVTRN